MSGQDDLPAADDPAKFDASTEMAMGATEECRHCHQQVEVLATFPNTDLPRAVGIRHRAGCPAENSGE